MRLFLAREALDPHLKVAGAMLNSQMPRGVRLKAAMKAGLFYSTWYPRQWLPGGSGLGAVRGLPSMLRGHLKFVARTSRRLGRRLFHAMVKFGPKLERQQVLLGRFVDIGTELFAMAATCSRAHSMLKNLNADQQKEVLSLADYFCAAARLRIERSFDGLSHNADAKGYRFAQTVLAGEHPYLKDGILK